MDRAEMLVARLTPTEEVDWKIIQEIMEGYASRFPETLAGCIEQVKLHRQTKVDKFALSGGEANMRHAYEIPEALHKVLSLKYPTIFQGKNLKQFLKLYPIFQVAEQL